jgi:hypothetical protein
VIAVTRPKFRTFSESGNTKGPTVVREDVIAGGVEALGEEGEDGALAAAAFRDEAGDGVPAEREAEAFEDRIEGGVPQQRRLGGGLGEWGLGEAEVLFERGHWGADPFLVRSCTRCAVRASR